MFKQEFQYLLSAIRFFTRIPLPSSANAELAEQHQALKYFPLIGWLVGAVSALSFHFAAEYWPATVAVILSIIVGILLTGALHEDGFGDSCDGFGGGWNRDQVLSIMKDPCIGSYAALGLTLLLLLKAATLVELASHSHELVLVALLFGHSASRLMVLPLPCLLNYARAGEDSRSRDMVKGGFSPGMLAYASLFVLVPLLILQVPPLWIAFAAAGVTVILMGLYFKHRLNGYTGDCLGATQQVTEVVIYLSLLGSWTSV